MRTAIQSILVSVCQSVCLFVCLGRTANFGCGVVCCLCVLLFGQPNPVYSQDKLPIPSHSVHQHELHQATPASPTDQKIHSKRLSIPDVPLVNQDGRPLRFYRDLVKDKVVAINFIFTTCTTICSPMGANFEQFQTRMGERMGQEIHLISVSIDPVIDTPQRLSAWGQKFHAGPGWTLVTGKKNQVDRLIKALKVSTSTENKWDHAPLIVVMNDVSGQWTRTSGFLRPDKLEDVITTISQAETQTAAVQEDQKDQEDKVQ